MPNNNNQIISYFTLRILIGSLGMLLPILLVISNYITNATVVIENSISDYYDNGTAGDILVGVLFVLGFFLLCYKGYNRTDNIASSVGGVAALGVALFPTTGNALVHSLHFVFATILFLVFIFFSLYLFRKGHANGVQSKLKPTRNNVYLICGIIMSLCVVSIGVLSFNKFTLIKNDYNLTFWLESMALIAFGFSWAIKGQMLWSDET